MTNQRATARRRAVADLSLVVENPRHNGGPVEGEPGDMMIVTLHDLLPPQVFMAKVLDDGYFDDELYEDIARARLEHQRGGGAERTAKIRAVIARRCPPAARRRTILAAHLDRQLGGRRGAFRDSVTAALAASASEIAGLPLGELTAEVVQWAYPRFPLVVSPVSWFPDDVHDVFAYGGGQPFRVAVVQDGWELLNCHSFAGRDHWVEGEWGSAGSTVASPEARVRKMRRQLRQLQDDGALAPGEPCLVYGLTKQQVAQLGPSFVHQPGRYRRDR